MGQAIRVQRTGGPEVLELVDYEAPEPGPGQVRVRVHAAGVNFIDTYFRSGAYPSPLPTGLGLEGSGVVDAVGEGVRELAPGERVAWAQVQGSYATTLLARAELLVKVPAGLDMDLAAGGLLQGMTAQYLVHRVRTTVAGEVALVHAAAGGTGHLLVQVLVQAGVRVLATCSSVEKEALVRRAGAHEVIRYTEVDFAARVRELTAGRGVDVVYDSVGKTTFDGSLKCIRPRGLMVLFGQASGAVPAFDPQRLNAEGSLFLTRPSLAHYVADRAERDQLAQTLFEGLLRGKLNVRIGASFPLREAGGAHAALEGRRTTGKVLLTMPSR
jgi:NADPH2:quinone reductase